MTLVPPSIRLFRLVYGAVVLLSALELTLIWPSLDRMVADTPALAASGLVMQIGAVVIGLVVPLLVWWFAGVRRSRIARLVLVVIVLIGVLSLLRTALIGQLALGMLGLVQLAGLALQVVALVLLFRPDANAWFSLRSGAL